mmetsp:Transcript_10646/g.19205  ORF Transcript_10646/g.19205 Transcript_10646/m.19205 type:complete len:103 (+) Transcript_10646:1165-1473(+)
MHGEAVNVDGLFCVVLSYLRGWIDENLRNRIFNAMKSMQLPTFDDSMTLETMQKGLEDAIEHRHGEQRVPLVKNGIGSFAFANDISKTELESALKELRRMHH